MGLNNTPDNFKAGKVAKFVDNWKQITTDASLLTVVSQGYHIEFESEPCSLCNRKEIHFYDKEKTIIDKLLYKFLEKDVIEETGYENGQIISNIFIRPKHDGSHRLILNLSNLNEHVEKRHFKMETLKLALSLVKQNCYFAKIDLKDAYYSIPIAQQFRKYLRFTWNGKLYQFTCLPNGLSSAPRVFTKLLKPIFSTLRKAGHINIAYIDDALLQSDNFDDCILNVKNTIDIVDSVGLTIHPDKSEVLPKQTIEFVGFLINSVDMTVRLTSRKAKDIVSQCSIILKKRNITIREFAQIIGKLVATEAGVLYAPLYYKPLEIQKDVE